MKTQKGIALVVSMVVLLVAALFGVSSFQSAQLEERMAGNHRFSVSALQAAEAGVNDMLDAVLAFNYVAGGPTFCSVIGSSLSGDWSESSSVSGAYEASGDISGGGLTKKYNAIMKCQASSEESAHVIGYSRGVVDPDVGNGTARLVKVEIVPPGFDAFKSMLAGCENVVEDNKGVSNGIIIGGNSVINGDVHANCDLSLAIRSQGNIKIPSSGSVTATGTADFEVPPPADGEDCTDVVCKASGVDPLPVPKAQSYIDYLTGYENSEGVLVGGEDMEYDSVSKLWSSLDGDKIEVLPYNPDTNECSTTGDLVEPVDFIDGAVTEINLGAGVKILERNFIYFCQGNLDTTVDFEGVTVVAMGDITHRGSATIDAGNYDDAGELVTSTDTLVVSGGSIVLRGSTKGQTYAAFWSVGDFEQKGSSDIYGAIVAGGMIDAEGGINFTAVESNTLYTPVSGRLEGWAELEDPGGIADLAGLVN